MEVNHTHLWEALEVAAGNLWAWLDVQSEHVAAGEDEGIRRGNQWE